MDSLYLSPLLIRFTSIYLSFFRFRPILSIFFAFQLYIFFASISSYLLSSHSLGLISITVKATVKQPANDNNSNSSKENILLKNVDI